MKPSTSVRKSSRSAWTPTAIAAAASSALTFSGPAASGAITGILPCVEHAREQRQLGDDRLADEAELRDRLGAQADVVAEERHGARAERGPEVARSRPASDARTISIPSAVVTRRPPTNSTGMPARSISSADLRARRRGRRTTSLSRASSSTASADRDATAPPTFTTMRLMSGSPR